MYYTMKLEEEKINSGTGTFALFKEHQKAIKAFLWLFLGFVVAFSFWFIALDSNESFKAQIETFCVINRPSEVSNCVQQYTTSQSSPLTGSVTKESRLFLIFSNNLYVLVFTLLFSLVFGAGVIFVLAWNASVIAAAVGIFAQSKLEAIPLGLARYMIHGIPEIGAYFVVALAGGLVSIAVVKHETGTQKFWEVLQDSLNLIIASIVILFLAALMEVYLTPVLF